MEGLPAYRYFGRVRSIPIYLSSSPSLAQPPYETDGSGDSEYYQDPYERAEHRVHEIVKAPATDSDVPVPVDVDLEQERDEHKERYGVAAVRPAGAVSKETVLPPLL